MTDIVFKYKGKSGLIMPEGKGKYFLSYGSPEEDSGRYVYGQGQILTTPFIKGKSINELINDLEFELFEL